MKRKYYYGSRIVYNIIRTPIRKILNFQTLHIPLIQNISPYARMRLFNFGTIRITGRVTIEDGVLIEANGGSITIESCFINRNTTIVSLDVIKIMKGVTIGPNVAIYDHDHNTSGIHDNEKPYICEPIIIEENVWIGANSVVLKGITLGKGAIIAAGSVVTKSVEANSIVAGVPARQIGVRN